MVRYYNKFLHSNLFSESKLINHFIASLRIAVSKFYNLIVSIVCFLSTIKKCLNGLLNAQQTFHFSLLIYQQKYLTLFHFLFDIIRLNNYFQMELNRVQSYNNYELLTSNGVMCQIIYGCYGNVQIVKSNKSGELAVMKKLNYKISECEIENMRKINHPNLVNMLDCFLDQKSELTYLILEYKECRTLFDLIKFTKIREKNIIDNVYKGILSLLEFMHAKNLYRLDIKPQNILVDSNNVPRLCYFAVSTNRTPRMSICRSLEYLAPEALLRLTYNNKVDIWALGILLFQIIEGKTPFQGRTQQEIFSSIKNPNVFSSNFSHEQIKLLGCLLKVNPRERMQAKQLLKNIKSQRKQSKQISKISTVDELSVTNSQNNTPRIKLMQIKPLELKSSQNIHITSIKKLDLPTSPTNQYFLKGEKAYSYSLYNKTKISLKKGFRRPDKN